MERFMKRTAAWSLLLTGLCICLYLPTRSSILVPFAVTAATTAYHFTMRLLVGTILNRLLGNRVDYTRPWFRVGHREMKLYGFLRVRRWKGRMPTFDKAAFDPSLRTWDEIAQAMCQSELIHECNALLSFLPLLASVWFGAFWVFLITSVLSAGFDLMLVAMQRFNRPRVLRLLSGKRA